MEFGDNIKNLFGINDEREIGKKIVIKQFTSTKELYNWLGNTDMEQLKEDMVKEYGKNSGEVNLEEMQFIITLK